MPRRSTIKKFKNTPLHKKARLKGLESKKRATKRKYCDTTKGGSGDSLTKKFELLSTAERPPAKRFKVPGGGTIPYDDADNDSGEDMYCDPINQYLEAFAKGAPKTSNNTIADLRLPSKQTLRKLDAEARSINKLPMRDLLESYKGNWDKWVCFLRNGFNLLFTGFGSKKKMIEDFAMARLNWGGLMVVNGFFKGMTVSSILTGISEKILNGVITRGRDNFTHVNNICGHMDKSNSVVDRVFVVVHNIDSDNISTPESQHVLGLLSNHPKIHLVASVDKYNADLLWNTRTLELFCWFRCATPTFAPYLEEMQECPEKGYLTETIDDTTRMARGVNHVLESLTPSHVDILKALGEECVERQVDGLTFKEWLTLSEEQMLATTDVQFRQKLEELMDHELVLKRKAKGDEDHKYFIPENVLQHLDLDT